MPDFVKRLFALRGIDFQEDAPPVQELYRQNIAIAWPATVEGALISIIGSVDTAMVGKLGSGAIAAVGITTQPRMILLLLAQSLCVGTTALIARRKGEDNRASANSVLAQSMYLVTALGILTTLIGYFFAEPFMRMAGANEDTLLWATEYFQVVSLGFLFNSWSLCLCAGMRAVGQTRITMVANITANLVNVFLNYGLIEGHWGFPALGVKGAAIATLCGTIVGAGIAFWFAIQGDGFLHFRPSAPRFDRETLRGLLRIGSSSMVEGACLRAGFFLNTKLVAGNGTAALATYQIVSQTTSLSFTLGDGLGIAGATLVGQSLGAKRKDLAQANVQISRKLSIVSSVLLMLVILFGRRQIALFFTKEPEIIADAMLAFLVIITGILPQNGRVVFSGCLRGAGDVRYVAMCSLISVTILRPLCTYLFCYPLNGLLPMAMLSVTGPWIAFVLDAFVREYLLYRRIKQGKWLNIRL
ncbi:MAG: MATE family efflux transporter [Christensenellales bacterium]